jgi:hypothetical protein
MDDFSHMNLTLTEKVEFGKGKMNISYKFTFPHTLLK